MSQFSNNHYNKQLKPLGRILRNDQTPGEKKLWREVLCDSKMLGYRFLRQRPISNYIADFFCKELGLLIEVDGSHHNQQVEQDKERDEQLLKLGYETLRLTHYNVMTDIINVGRNIEAKVVEIERKKGLKPKSKD